MPLHKMLMAEQGLVDFHNTLGVPAVNRQQTNFEHFMQFHGFSPPLRIRSRLDSLLL
jgi:hypothetical protein